MLHNKSVAPGTLQLLNSISSIPELSDFFLAGGTALALQIGHRISVDLDFFGNRPFTTDEVLALFTELKPLSIISQNKNMFRMSKLIL